MINRKPKRTRKRELWQEVALPEGTYSDEPLTQQDLVNCLKESAEQQGARVNFWLPGVPGLKPRCTVGEGPFRGGRNVESKRFAVLGNYLYQFNTAMTSATRLGYVPGTGLVQMSHNQIAGGHEVAISTGSAGYAYNTVTEVFAKITDASFSGGKSVTFIDQMFVWVDAQGRFFQPSDIAAGTVYTALEEQEAEMAPDRIQCAIAAHQELLVFGKDTLQFYQSTGDPEELFADKKSGIDYGIASPHAVALIDNTVIWVDQKGVGRRLNGGIAQRITTHAIEKQWAQCDLSKCSVFVWEDVGHAVVYFQFPDGKTWGYDCATQRWHRRKSKDMDRWMVNGLVQWDGVWYAGAFNSGTISELDWEYPLEGCDELLLDVGMPVLHNGGNLLQVDGVRVLFDTGHPTVECVEPVEITPTIPPTYQYYIVQNVANLASNPSLVYGRVELNTFVTEELGYFDWNSAEDAAENPGINMAGRLITIAPFDSGPGTAGIYAYTFASSTFAQLDFWAKDNTKLEHYFKVVQFDPDTLVAVVYRDSPDATYLHAISFDGTSLTEAGTGISLGNNRDTTIVLHKGGIITAEYSGSGGGDGFGDRQLKAYTLSGGVFTLAATYASALKTRSGVGPSGIQADDDYIYLSSGQIFAWDGAASLTLVASAYDGGTAAFASRFAVVDGAVFYRSVVDNTRFKAFSFVAGVVTAVPADDIVVVSPETFFLGPGWAAAKDNIIYLPADNFYPTEGGGIFTTTGTTNVKNGPLKIVYSAGEGQFISLIDPLDT